MKKVLSISIGLIVTVMMLAAVTVSSFAEADIEQFAGKSLFSAKVTSQLTTGQTVTAKDINAGEPAVYTTPQASGYQTFSYKVKMPKAGTLALIHASANGTDYVSIKTSSGTSKYADQTDTLDEGKINYYYLEAGTYTMDISISDGDKAAIACSYAPIAAKLLTNGKTYHHGSKGNTNTYTTIKVNAPSKGYIALDIIDGTEASYRDAVKIKTKGFKDFNYVYSADSQYYRTQYIGVKKGTYTIKVKTYAPIYSVKYKFVKTKEGAFGTKKSKAKKITKGKVRKGVIITDSKKVHWYKFKNPKKQKVNIVYKTKINGGGNYGGIKVTVYGKGTSTSRVIFDDAASTTVNYYNSGTKLAKGTYYVKVQSYKNGTGFFSLKWK